MRINADKGMVNYEEIKAGECFRYCGKLHIKGDYATHLTGELISIDLETGIAYNYSSVTQVLPVDAHVVVDGC